MKGERWLHEFVICHLFRRPPDHSARSLLSPFVRLLAIGYWLFCSQPRAVVEVDRDQEEDSFDYVERDIGDGEAK